MTIHASKGLEAPVVFLADCNNRARRSNAYTALVDWPAGVVGIMLTAAARARRRSLCGRSRIF